MWLRALLVEHFWLKLFSLLLATLVWMAVNANIDRQTVSREFDARETTTNFIARPVLILTDSGAHPPMRVEPSTVDIAVRGGVTDIGRLDPLDIRAFVRIPERPDFEGTVAVYVQLPKEAALVMVSPSIVRVGPAGANPNPNSSQAP
jgi:hypothetical protein